MDKNKKSRKIHKKPTSYFIDSIFLEDCINGMKKIKSNSIDLVVTDPPYFLDGLDNTWNEKKLTERGSSKVVGNLPKGMKFSKNQSKKFYEFYKKVSERIFKILKPGGAFLSFSSPRLYHSMAMAVEDAGFEIRDMLGWIYTTSQVKAFTQDYIISNDKQRNESEKKKLMKKCKDLRTIQLKPAIEPICLAIKPYDGRIIDNFDNYGTGLIHIENVGIEDDHFPANIITTEKMNKVLDTSFLINPIFLVPKPSKEEKKNNTHPSIKPVELIAHLIKLFSSKNSIVLDPFMGSGTTAVATILTDRHFIGFEINEEYLDIAQKRIDEVCD